MARFGIVGLGRMGSDLALQAVDKGHEVVGYNRSPDDTRKLAKRGVIPAFSYEEFASNLRPPRIALAFVPHGEATDEVIGGLARVFERGDVVGDGGNSHWKDAQKHADALKPRGIGFLDVGTSGGVEGARRGACFMIGGDADAFRMIEPILRDLSLPHGVLHAGPLGAGHFVKLVHNAIEFGMVQAIAEGVEMIRRSDYDVDIDSLATCWAHGSVIRGWLMELLEKGLREHPGLSDVSSYVEDTKEGKWYVEYALEKEIHAPVTTLSELMFYRYRDRDSISGKTVSLLRHGFSGHPLYEAREAPRAQERPA